MKRKMIFLMLTLMVLSAASVNAQVTIGSGNEPHAGAVLDLQSTTQGFKLPSVALNDDLTQFVLPEDETSTKENAIGMLVFNTNPDIGAGIYAWTGTNWISAGNEHGTSGPDLVVGSNTYQTYIYPGTIGTWMLTPSKEGTPDFTTYPDKAEGERGYYYRKANYASACPEGWHVPNRDEWQKRASYMNLRASALEWAPWTRASCRGGFFVTAASVQGWDTKLTAACDDDKCYGGLHSNNSWFVGVNVSSTYALTVFCVKNP